MKAPGEIVGTVLDEYMLRADHLAFVAQVREVARLLDHAESCDAYDHDWIDWDGEGRPFCPPIPKCSGTCPRGRLLAMCER